MNDDEKKLHHKIFSRCCSFCGTEALTKLYFDEYLCEFCENIPQGLITEKNRLAKAMMIGFNIIMKKLNYSNDSIK
jgi:hypothetical protein